MERQKKNTLTDSMVNKEMKDLEKIDIGMENVDLGKEA